MLVCSHERFDANTDPYRDFYSHSDTDSNTDSDLYFERNYDHNQRRYLYLLRERKRQLFVLRHGDGRVWSFPADLAFGDV
jgi:hypothetical protein